MIVTTQVVHFKCLWTVKEAKQMLLNLLLHQRQLSLHFFVGSVINKGNQCHVHFASTMCVKCACDSVTDVLECFVHSVQQSTMTIMKIALYVSLVTMKSCDNKETEQFKQVLCSSQWYGMDKEDLRSTGRLQHRPTWWKGTRVNLEKVKTAAFPTQMV